MWPRSGEGPPPAGTLQTSEMKRVLWVPYLQDHITLNALPSSTVTSAVITLLYGLQWWWDRKHLMWLLLKTIYMTFINFSSLFFHYGS